LKHFLFDKTATMSEMNLCCNAGFPPKYFPPKKLSDFNGIPIIISVWLFKIHLILRQGPVS
jgi:hypothetical protein